MVDVFKKVKNIMKYLLLLFIPFSAFSQVTTVIDKNLDTIITTYKASTPATYTPGTSSSYTTVIKKYKAVGPVDTIVVPPPPPPTGTILYEGFGANAVGGAKSTAVYRVKTVADFNKAVGSNRTILFDNDLSFTARIDLIGISYMTIDGNGYDVVINNNNNGDGISFDGSNTHHCILKGITVTNAGNDGINVLDGAHDIMITNCASYGNRDGNIDVAGGNNVTIQYCILGGGAAGWAGDMLITGTNVSAHHNLFSPATSGEVGERCPFVHANYSSASADIRNNLIWKFGRSGGTGSGYGSAIAYNATGNIINNYYYTAGSSKGSETNTDDGYGGGNTGKAYISGNISGNGVNANAASTRAIWPCPAVTTQDACTAAAIVLAQAGPRPLNAANQKLVSAVTLNGCNK